MGGRTWSTGLVTLFALSMVLGRVFVFGLVRQGTDAMTPLLGAGEIALFWRHAEPEVGDVVVVELPDELGVPHIERVVAIGPATVEVVEGRVFVDGQRLSEGEPVAQTWTDRECRERTAQVVFERSGERRWSVELVGEAETTQLGPGEIYVLGDRRGSSEDSRQWGPVRPSWVHGVAAWRFPAPGRCGAGRRWDRLGRLE